MIRQKFTPPTCTLEIVANTSPLSQWAGRPVLKNLNFDLRFDAPQLPQDEHILVKGDRFQLEALSEAVERYIQDLLQAAPYSLPLLTNTNHDELENSATVLVLPRQEESLAVGSTAPLQNNDAQLFKEGIYLKPNGLLAHDLFLGSLANEQSGKFISLSVLQLFDLATALEECSHQFIALPNLNNSATIFQFPEWARTAALIAITAGVTTILMSVLQRSPQVAMRRTETTQTTTQLPAATPLPQVAVAPTVLPPPPPPPAAEKLPKLPPLNMGEMQPLPSTVPPNMAQVPPAPPQNTIAIPPAPNTQPTNVPPPPAVVVVPNLPPPATPQTIPESILTPTRPTENPPAIPTPNLPAGTVAKEPNQPVGGSIPNTPPAASPKAPELPPSLPNVNLEEKESVAAAPPNMADSPQPSAPPPAKPAITAARRADTNTQIDEARSYFQQRWKPSTNLSRPLEYTLTVKADGTLEQVTPRGIKAGEMINSAGMPPANQPFLSPSSGESSTRIRVVLYPDGRVQTFAEPFKEGY